MEIILASSSPRRKELLKSIFKEFTIINPDIDESKYPLESISLEKCKKVAFLHKDALVIAADTYVSLNNQIFGKPVDEKDAFNTLKALSNKTHSVTTYYTFMRLSDRILYTSSVTTLVTFKELSDELILSYIASKSPLDKAGSYGIQDNDKFDFIASIDGSYKNVMGLPVEQLLIDLNRFNIKV